MIKDFDKLYKIIVIDLPAKKNKNFFFNSKIADTKIIRRSDGKDVTDELRKISGTVVK